MSYNSNAPLVNSLKNTRVYQRSCCLFFVGGFLKKAPTPPKTFDKGFVRRPFVKSKFIVCLDDRAK